MILSLSLENEDVYRGLDVVSEAGKLVLRTAPEDAMPIMTANLASIEIDREEVVLTGAMAIWAYLVVFHWLHGRTKKIWYEDGLGRRVLVASHG